ncbi:MAG TPA: lipocalin family protein [Acidobacteriaceae bacterium]|nr:lipocalin family protein [Acidobacteriaceae bacterium]
MNRSLRIAATCLSLLWALIAVVPSGVAQSATAVPQLDANQLLGTYYVIARYPIKRKRQCVGKEVVLYALGDKKRAIEIVSSCPISIDSSMAWNWSGKLSKDGDGKIKIAWIWPVTKKYWILDLAPDASWALAGTPNHKKLWILSRTPEMRPETLATVETMAAGQGFNTAKLIQVKQGD